VPDVITYPLKTRLLVTGELLQAKDAATVAAVLSAHSPELKIIIRLVNKKKNDGDHSIFSVKTAVQHICRDRRMHYVIIMHIIFQKPTAVHVTIYLSLGLVLLRRGKWGLHHFLSRQDIFNRKVPSRKLYKINIHIKCILTYYTEPSSMLYCKHSMTITKTGRTPVQFCRGGERVLSEDDNRKCNLEGNNGLMYYGTETVQSISNTIVLVFKHEERVTNDVKAHRPIH
ncbi:hypothetical protein AGLY_001037, partial [Aphis glycines]